MFWELINEKETSINETISVDNDLFEPDLISKIYVPISLIPIVCSFSVITNLLNIAVFLHPKMKDATFKYMLMISVSNCLYAGLLSYGYVIYCNDCSLNSTYGTLLFKILVEYFFTSCLAMFSILVEIVISIHRYCILKNNGMFHSQTSLRWIAICLFVFSILFYLPVVFTYEVKSIEIVRNSSLITYTKVKTEFGRTSIGQSLPIIQSLVRIFLSTIVLSIVNIANIIEFRKRFKKKLELKLKKLVAEEQSSK